MNPPYHLIKSNTVYNSDQEYCLSNELRRGRQATTDLLRHLKQRKDSSNVNVDSLHSSAFVLVMKIIDSFSNSLSMLASQDPAITEGGPTASGKSKSMTSSFSGGGKMCHKPSCRKGDSWTQLTSGLSTDGYAWRKYGQKLILNAKHPRSYYKCTNRPYCQALKRVQKMDDEPPMYKITHTGHHTCENRPSSTGFSDMDSSILFNFYKENINEEHVKFPADRERLAALSSSFKRDVKGSEECKSQQYLGLNYPNNSQPSIVEEMESSGNVQWSLDDYDYLIGSVEFNDLHT